MSIFDQQLCSRRIPAQEKRQRGGEGRALHKKRLENVAHCTE
jgi:hypothetical protein